MTAYKAPCEHGMYDAHPVVQGQAVLWASEAFGHAQCPGGTLLPPDTLVIVPGDDVGGRRFWPEWANEVVGSMDLYRSQILDALAAAQPGKQP